jgi:hypothetical protein
MIYQVVSERHAPSYRIASPRDVFGALTRYANARCKRLSVLTLDGAHQLQPSSPLERSLPLYQITFMSSTAIGFSLFRVSQPFRLYSNNRRFRNRDSAPLSPEPTYRCMLRKRRKAFRSIMRDEESTITRTQNHRDSIAELMGAIS